MIMFIVMGNHHTDAPVHRNSEAIPAIIPIEITQIPAALDQGKTQSGPAVSVLGWKSPIPIHQRLANSDNDQLRALAAYEQALGGGLTDRLMTFTDMPTNTKQAAADAGDMASLLKEFSANNIQPLVILEPTIGSEPINFQSYRVGGYDSILSAYFQALKDGGITDAMMGMWVYFPEANLPQWGPVDQADFATNVTRSVNLQKKYFPGSQASILLDAMSYPAGSTGWDEGAYVSLSPFIDGIPKGLLDSFGLQGFPWVPAANVKGWPNLDPATFLNTSLAAQAAQLLGTKNIWLNSGSFRAMYTQNVAQTVTMSASQRQTILEGVAQQARNLQKTGFNVAINLFSEDKSNTAEAADWSYKTADAQVVLVGFISELQSHGIGFWFFD